MRFYLVDPSAGIEVAMLAVFLNSRHKGVPERPGPIQRPQPQTSDAPPSIQRVKPL
jgi:hypothetical protein